MVVLCMEDSLDVLKFCNLGKSVAQNLLTDILEICAFGSVILLELQGHHVRASA